MRILFIVTLVLNLLMEGLAAAGLISQTAATGEWAQHYGFAALAIASMIIWVWPYRDSYAGTGAALGFLMTFHIALTISLFLAGNQMGGLIGHAVMSVLCIVCFTQRRSWCTS